MFTMPDSNFFHDLSEKAIEIILNFKSEPKHDKSAANEIENLKKNIRREIVSLPEKQREVLELRYLDGLSFDEMSKRTNRSSEELNEILSEAIVELKGRLRKKDLEGASLERKLSRPEARKEVDISTNTRKFTELDRPKVRTSSFVFFSLIFLLIIVSCVYILVQGIFINKGHFFFFGHRDTFRKEISHITRSSYNSKHIRVSGSTSLLKLSSLWKNSFRSDFSHYTITLVSSDSDKGINELINGRVDIANSSRPVGFSDKKKAARSGIELTEYRVALDALVIILNKKNPIEELSIEDLEKIFGGEVKKWDVFGNFNELVVPLVRERGSGTNDFVLSRIVQAGDFPAQMLRLNSNQKIFNLISKELGAISYINSGNYPWGNKDIKLVRVKSFPESPSYSPFVRRKLNEQIIRYGDYPLSHYLYLITTNEPPKCASDFVKWVLSQKGQEIVSNFGLIPVYTEED